MKISKNTIDYFDGLNENVQPILPAMATNPHKADFSDQSKFDLNMRTNMLLNRNNPDAQELANIFLGDPYKAPYSEEYKHLPAGSGKVLNSKYNLTKTNKEIKNYSEGFAYSRY